MEDLTRYTDDELSLRVFNDEGLYLQRHDTGFLELLSSIFIYTPEQLQILKDDLQDEG